MNRWMILLLTLALHTVAGAEELLLASEGKAQCVIVTGKEDGISLIATMAFSEIHYSLPAKVVGDAAAELAAHLDEMAAIWNPKFQVKVVPEIAAAKAPVRILLGTAAVEEYGLQEEAAGLPYPAYVYRTVGSDLLIFGSSSKGTANGVYGFLQDELGVRWFGPQSLFTVVPRQASLAIGALDKRVEPSFAGRTVSFDSRIEHPAYRWARRMRGKEFQDTGEPFGNSSHNVWRLFPPSRYYEEHPEYYAMRNGKRTRADRQSHHFAICWSNEEVIEIAAEAARAYFRSRPYHHSFSLGINDSAAICDCESCANLQPERTFRKARVASDMYYHFVNEVARRVHAEFPDRYIGLIAYNDVTPPPVGPMEKNVHVVLVNDISEYFDAELRARDAELVEGWQEKGITMGLYYYTGLAKLVPAYFPHLLDRQLKDKHERGFTNIHSESAPGWPWRGPMGYVEMRLLWDVTLDVDALLDEYFTTLFGPAAAPMASLYALFEEIHLRPRSGGFLYEHYKLDQFRPYTATDLAKMRQLLEAAHAAVEGVSIGYNGQKGKEAQRVAYVSRGLMLFLDMLDALCLADRLGEAPTDDVAALQQLQCLEKIDVILRRHEQLYRETIASDPSHSRRYLSDTCVAVREAWKQKVGSAIAPALADLHAREASFDPRVREKIARQVVAFAADDLREMTFSYLAGRLATGDNLVVNPGFEELAQEFDFPPNLDWRPSPAHGWTYWQRVFDTGAFDVATDMTHGGERAGRIRGIGDGCYITTVPGVQPGETYLVEAQVMNSAEVTREDKPKVKLEVRWLDANGRWTQQGIRFADECNELNRWVPLQCLARIPDGAATAVLFILVSSLHDDETIHVDDVSFRKLVAAE